MNGRLASIVGPVDLTPGISATASFSSGGKAALSALKAGIAADSVRGSWTTVLRSATFSRANASGGRVEVRDQVLERLRVGVERAGRRSLRDEVVGEVVGLDSERVVRNDRRVLVGRQPVLDRCGCTTAPQS